MLGSAELASWGGSTALLECCEFKLSGVVPVREHFLILCPPQKQLHVLVMQDLGFPRDRASTPASRVLICPCSSAA